MTDLSLSVTLSRTLLSLTALELNDHSAYEVGAGFLGGQASWNRVAATSPFYDGDIPLWKTKQPVQDALNVKVFSQGSNAQLMTNLATLVNALNQFQYTLTATIQSQVHTWTCETVNYAVTYDGPHWVAQMIEVKAVILRQPNPIAGPF